MSQHIVRNNQFLNVNQLTQTRHFLETGITQVQAFQFERGIKYISRQLGKWIVLQRQAIDFML